MRTLSISLLLLFAGCTGADTVSIAPGALPAGTTLDSRLYDLSSTDIPAQHVDVVTRAINRVDSLSRSQPFLDAIAAKNDWSFASDDMNGDRIAQLIERGVHAESDVRVRPPLSFYTPPAVGWDTCGGFSFLVKKTSSNGCRKSDGSVHRNLRSLTSDHKVLASFLLHEWMHAAGFGHNGNRGQCTEIKRNSVPIYVGCLSEAHPDSREIDKCSLSCPPAQ